MGFSRIIRHGNLLNAALGDVTRRPLKSLVSAICLSAILFPIITALAINEGLRSEAAIGAEAGADFYVSSGLLGGEGPLPLRVMTEIAARQGVVKARARVVGRTYFVDRLVAVIGLDRDGIEALKPLVRGRIPRARGEVLVGEAVAEAFDIRPGPGMRFTLAANKRHVFTPTGTLAPSCLWGSDVLIVGLEDANAFFQVKDLATQLLVWTDLRTFPEPAAGAEGQGKQKVGRFQDLKITGRHDIGRLLESAYAHKGGIFHVLWIVGAALAIPAFLVTSGFGMKELAREVGVMKAIGWRHWEVLEKTFVENLLISLTTASLSLLLSMAWMKGLNGALIAQFYIAEVGILPLADIPSRYLPSHGLFCLGFALCVTLAGSLFSTWRHCRKPPVVSMR